MEFFLEMVLTAVVALLFSFVVAKLVSVASAGGGNGLGSELDDKSRIHVEEDVYVEELRFGQKMEARVEGSERSFGILEENVEHVDRFVGEPVRVAELDIATTGSGEIGDERDELAAESSEADSTATISPDNAAVVEMLNRGLEEAESCASFSPENVIGVQEERKSEPDADVSPENVIAEEMGGRGLEERNFVTGAIVSPENVIEEDMGAGEEEERKSESGDAVSPANVVAEDMIIRGQDEGSESEKESSDHVEIENRDVTMTEPEEISVEESDSKDEIQGKTEELNIEEEEDEDDWEGIEKSELENAFAAAAKFVEESGDVLEIGNDAKTELYGLHKIATEGPCRDSSPMALMVSARAKCDEQDCLRCARNAWQKLGNMSQEEAMEQYLALLSKEIPGQLIADSTFEKKPETGTSVVLPFDSGSLEQPLPLNTTDSKHEAVEGDINEVPDLDNKFQAKGDSSI